AIYCARDLNVMLLGEEAAEHLGVEVETSKRILLVAASVLTAIAVAASGIIGFVGLIVPHVVRILIGPDHWKLIPAAGVAGAILVVLADLAARTLLAPVEIPLGVVTSLFGAPFFIYLLRRHRRTYFS
ncbi:MAG TPA: iron chelate uptake ABC transporter family permease subunit, partial [Syntrophothermus lipocalidus]|nr:iron chelate uptake ABC transporter family permease subunit [Syntrophothermus lipocalidus]